MEAQIFQNREDAARQLAAALRDRELRDPVVLGIPRGGVVTACVLAGELGAECDVVLARKLRAPHQPELAIGAVAEDGEVYLSPHAGKVPGVDDDYLAQERDERHGELDQRRRMFRDIRPAAALEGRSVIVTDDGIATGSTMLAAVEILKRKGPHELIVAVPVAPPGRLNDIRRRCDYVVCLQTPESFMAIGQFYQDFDQVQDDQVKDILKRFAPQRPADRPPNT